MEPLNHQCRKWAAGLLVAAVNLLTAAGVAVASPEQLRQKTMPDPNDPDKTRKVVTRAERDSAGLRRRSWTGVVDREVFIRLEKLNDTVARLKDKMKKDKDVKAFDTLWRVRFKGMVYVEVQTINKDSRSRVLASLKASEIHGPYLLDNAPGFTGYVSKAGLDKLGKNPEVVGVCLDDKPLPERRKPIVRDDLPPAQSDASATQPGVGEGIVDPDVYRAFALTERVDVMIHLKGDTIPKPTDTPSEMLEREELRDQEATRLQNRVLSTLNADQLWVEARVSGAPTISGSITKDGLEKLWNNPEVVRVYLQDRRRPSAMPSK